MIDSGASHILIREADAHILTELQYSHAHLPPFAVLKTANGDPLQAIGKGNLAVGPLHLPAYVFKVQDLVNNLLGLAPFADQACTSIFRPSSFQIFPHKGTTPIMVGTRQSSQSLWMVPLGPSHMTAVGSDGIPPPHPGAALHTTIDGVYIEANHVSQHDNASYVRFIHACLGFLHPPLSCGQLLLDSLLASTSFHD